ncbi:hypothetical protein ACCO45_010226 [Purpureocillium lilacinum]|uniref:Uncharacterized protein n=1 Tax=Purpureocillium lilacinum TaxID=33203 RepID=A0ACC4DF05_PURLI
MESETAPAHQPSKDGGAECSMAQNESKIERETPSTPAPEAQLADEIRLRRFTEEVLDTRQEELELQEAENKRLLKKLESLKKELADTQDQLIEARNQSKAKSKQLQDAKDQIFRLQPRRKDITESEAQEAYKRLCSNVQRWVENRLPGTLDDMEAGRLRSRPSGVHAGRFVSLIREPAKRCLGVHQSDEHHAIAVIMYYLWLALFSKSFYCPLDGSDDDATIIWIDELESTMSKLPRDTAHCREWRSETLTALTMQPLFKSRRATYINLVSEDLAALLSVVVPKGAPSDLQSSIRRTIVEPAADFAHQLHLAANIYSLKWPARNASTRLEVYECINLANGGLVLDLSGTGPRRPRVARPNVLVYAGDGEAPQRPTLIKWLADNSNGGGGSREQLPRTSAPRRSFVQHPPGKRR